MANMHSWQSRLNALFLTPVFSRLGFDITASTFLAISIKATLQWFGVPSYSWFDGFLLVLIVIACQGTVGLYNTLVLAKLRYKTAIIALSHLLAILLLLLTQPFTLGLLLFGVSSAVIMIFPRIVFNASFLRKQYLPPVINEALDDQPVLVVGGAGYIGSHVVSQLLASGYRVRVLDTFTYGHDSLAEFKKNPNLEIQVGDVTDIFQLTSAVKDARAVIHLAGIVGDPACALDEELTQHVNIVSTRMLKEAVKAFQIPRFIFASSCSVYGSNDETVNEHSELNPVSLYARTKIDSEREILGDLYDAFHPTILRFSTVFGHSRRMRFDLVTNLFTAQAFYDGEIQVSGGDQWRPFIHVSDVARAIILTLEAPLSQVSRQIYNVGDDRLNATIAQIGDHVKNIVKTKKGNKSVKVTQKPFISDRRNYSVSFHKIKSQLGFEAAYDLKEGIKEMYDHLKSGSYPKPYKDFIYSNVEMTRTIQETFTSPEYRQTHFSALAVGPSLAVK